MYTKMHRRSIARSRPNLSAAKDGTGAARGRPASFRRRASVFLRPRVFRALEGGSVAVGGKGSQPQRRAALGFHFDRAVPIAKRGSRQPAPRSSRTPTYSAPASTSWETRSRERYALETAVRHAGSATVSSSSAETAEREQLGLARGARPDGPDSTRRRRPIGRPTGPARHFPAAWRRGDHRPRHFDFVAGTLPISFNTSFAALKASSPAGIPQ